MSLLQQLRVSNSRLQDENSIRLEVESQNLALTANQEILVRENRELKKKLDQTFLDLDLLSRQVQDLEERSHLVNVEITAPRQIEFAASLEIPRTVSVMVQTTVSPQCQSEPILNCIECQTLRAQLGEKITEITELGILLSRTEETIEALRLADQKQDIRKSIVMNSNPSNLFHAPSNTFASGPTEMELDLKYINEIGGSVHQVSAIPFRLHEPILNHSPSLRKFVEGESEAASDSLGRAPQNEKRLISDVERNSFDGFVTCTPSKMVKPSSFTINSQKSLEMPSNNMVESLTFTMIGSWVIFLLTA
jgi:hypothetical protein